MSTLSSSLYIQLCSSLGSAVFFTWSSAEGELDRQMPSVGNAGRLVKWSTMGVGVFDGRVLRPTGRTGKDLEPVLGVR